MYRISKGLGCICGAYWRDVDLGPLMQTQTGNTVYRLLAHRG